MPEVLIADAVGVAIIIVIVTDALCPLALFEIEGVAFAVGIVEIECTADGRVI
jgi:hypothetical protein